MVFALDKIINVSTVQVVGVYRSEEAEAWSFIRVRKKDASLELLDSGSAMDFAALLDKLDKKKPVLLVLDGKGVLLKKTETGNASDVNWLRSLDLATLYFISFTDQDAKFISFCRKTVIDDYADKLTKEGFVILDHFAGGLCAVLLKESLKTDTVFSNDVQMDFQGQRMVGMARKKETPEIGYRIGDTLLDNHTLPLYGSAAQYFADPVSIDKSKATGDKQEFIYKKAFNIFGIAILSAFFLLLLTSYLSIQYFNAKNAELSLNNLYFNQSVEEIQAMKHKKDEKMRILKETGFSSARFLAYYAYDLAASCPSAIRFTELIERPLEKEVKANEKVGFQNGILTLKGETMDEAAFNPWLEKIRKRDWMQKVEIISLKMDKNNTLRFELKMILKDV